MTRYQISGCFLLAVLLGACGGTSGSSSSSDNTGGSDTDVRSTADIKTEAEFELKSTASLQVTVNLSELVGQRAYLYICQKQDVSTLNYDRCLVKTPMSDGQYSGTFTLGNEIETLGMEVWSYDPAEEPRPYSWARSQSGMTWDVSS